ncbi:MAG: helix-turn-helix domain-containing protein, partial [Gemmatimonadaceae bacterium]|nr:helix-turn-helix domain-containing protein [Gemmatimonadaceae bacterium]
VARWKRRFVEGGVLALADAPRAGRGHGSSATTKAKIVDTTRHKKPPAPLTHWTSRRLARRIGVGAATIVRVWRRHGLKPHRLDRYSASPGPDFETKAADIIALSA